MCEKSSWRVFPERPSYFPSARTRSNLPEVAPLTPVNNPFWLLHAKCPHSMAYLDVEESCEDSPSLFWLVAWPQPPKPNKPSPTQATCDTSGGCVGLRIWSGYDDLIVLDQSNTRYLHRLQSRSSEQCKPMGHVCGRLADFDNDGHKDVFSVQAVCAEDYSVWRAHVHGVGQRQHVHASLQLGGHRQRRRARRVWMPRRCLERMWKGAEDARVVHGPDGLRLAGPPATTTAATTEPCGRTLTDIDLFIAKCRQFVNDPNDPRRINQLWVLDRGGARAAAGSLRAKLDNGLRGH